MAGWTRNAPRRRKLDQSIKMRVICRPARIRLRRLAVQPETVALRSILVEIRIETKAEITERENNIGENA